MSEMRNWWTTPRWEMDMSPLTNEIAALRAQLITAERERDEARRERDAIRGQYAMSLEEQVELVRQREETSSQLWDCMNERDGWKHRAERAERVVEAAREPSEELVLQAAAVFGGHRNFYGTEEQIDMVIRAAVRALEAAEGSNA